ncbi:ABC transporter substrate-binding protein [Paenibacillus sp. UNC499MF]|uniref:ABC transporter substrate-binding protein n=1 Tax=Paenibacillus sp. UNC499MF TaxID=1502751 RepID=UPI0008A09102|nr:ABC transporter substrate-binding protein [Paenibacillus sp. UNC499MF]SEG75026.1 ABC-type Fe3+-hydroxamate transport system, substrate-binding protein [Paenibacillus sp. UNC499MF]
MREKGLNKAVWSMLTALALAAMLSGCGEKGGSAESTAVKSTPAGEKTEGDKRLVKDAFGEVEIPAKPKKVAAIYLEDYVTALGVTPVVQWYHPNWGIQEYLKLNVPKFDMTGSIEALLEAGPDLIIVDGGADKAKYDMYSKVAPTYRLPEDILTDAPAILKTTADLLGVPEKAETILKDYGKKVDDAKTALKKAVGTEKVAVIRLNVGEKTFTLFGVNNRFIGSILYRDLGLTPPPMVKDMKEFQQIISEEMIPQIDADHIILLPSNGDWASEENKEAVQLLKSPFWKSVPAVKNGHVYQVERTHWQTGAFLANGMKIDDLLKLLVK